MPIVPQFGKLLIKRKERGGKNLEKNSILYSYFRERREISLENESSFQDKKAFWEDILGQELLMFMEDQHQISRTLYSKDFEISHSYQSESEKVFNSGMYCKEYIPNNKTFNQILFFNYYSILLKVGVSLIKQKWQFEMLLSSNIIGSFAERLYNLLSQISIRTLVLELNICKETNKLSGTNEKEEYEYFCAEILNENYIKKLFQIYPVLKRCVFGTIDTCVNNFLRVFDRFVKDKEIIEANLLNGKKIKDIETIQCSESDTHRHGQSVFIFKFKGGDKLVYKPHSLQCEIAYYDFVSTVGSKSGINMYCPKIIDKGDYGWVEFIEYQQCLTKSELKNYYKRLGLFIMVNYLLNVNDMHYENLIAFGEYPVIVDLETILHNKRTWNAKTANQKIAQELEGSVLNSGILPKYIWGNNIADGVNVSAINGDGGQEFPIKMPMLKDEFSSRMHFDYTAPKTTAKKNIAKCKNEASSDPRDYVEDIAKGFYKTYTCIMHNKDFFINESNRFKNLNVRFIVRNTQRYAMLLNLSYHPFFLQDGAEREMLLSVLYKDIDRNDPKMISVVENEIYELLNGDIPYFLNKTDGLSLKNEKGIVAKAFFEKTSIEVSKEKILNLNETDCKRQLSYIALALSSLSKYHMGTKRRDKLLVKTKSKSSIYSNCYMRSAEKIAHYLDKTAVFNDDKSEVSWVGIGIIGNKESRWNVAPLDAYLYDGIAGIAIFFWTYRKLMNTNEFDMICTALKTTMFHYTDFVFENRRLADLTGAFSGESSVLYAYEILYKLSGDEGFLDYAKKHTEVLASIIDKDNNYDILLGNAGAIHVFINMYMISQKQEYLSLAEDAAEHLVKNAISVDPGIGWKSLVTVNPLAGFSHGVAGIVSALLRLESITKNKKYFSVVQEALKYEQSLYIPEMKNWCDRRELNNVPSEQQGIGPVAWCHGASGILLSRMIMLKYVPDILKGEIEKQMHIAAKTTMTHGFNGTHSLCHGDTGNLEILTTYARKIKNERLLADCLEYSKRLAGIFIEGNWNCGLPYNQETPSFMLGLAGMGYSMMRYQDINLPMIIALQI